VLATRRKERAPLHMEHLPERFALLVILSLGKAVAGAATGVYDAKWADPSIAVGVSGSSSRQRCGGTTSTSPPR
jgi:low temperature requirement protein LtrA